MQKLQYDLFTPRSVLSPEESHAFRLDMQAMLESSCRVRKSLFAKIQEQNKIISKLVQEIEDLKSNNKKIYLDFSEEEQSLFRKYS